MVVALADKLETLVGLFAIGQLPTGDKDPFALRRHALGVIRMLIEKDLPLALDEVAEPGRGAVPARPTPRPAPCCRTSSTTGSPASLREQGYSAQEVDAVLALRPQRLGDVAKRLAAVRAFAALPEAAALAAANKRIGNILKKAEKADAHVSEVAAARKPAEKALYDAMTRSVAPQGRRAVRRRRLHRLAADAGRAARDRSTPSSTA